MARVEIVSMMALASPSDNPSVWTGEADVAGPDDVFRFFNRVDEGDNLRLEQINYNLPSLSVGDIFTIDGTGYRVLTLGFQEITVEDIAAQALQF